MRRLIDALFAFFGYARVEWRQVGIVGVDTATILIGDPCYYLEGADSKRELASSHLKGKPWYEQGVDGQLFYKAGHAGLGVLVKTNSDGGYPVYAKFKDGRPVQISIALAHDEVPQGGGCG